MLTDLPSACRLQSPFAGRQPLTAWLRVGDTCGLLGNDSKWGLVEARKGEAYLPATF